MQKNKITMNFLPNKTIPFSTIIIPFLCLFLILSPTPHGVAAQSPNNNSNNSNNDLAGYANFSPSMAIIIVVLVGALFFMGFFSIYIRHCSDPNSTTARTGILSVHGRRAGAGSRGLDQSVIDTFPTFTYAEVKDHKIGKGALECAVCLNEFEDSETLRLIPKCDHVFHPECIDAWLQSHMTCPVCRANLNQQPGEEGTYQMPEVSNQEDQENVGEGQRTDDAAAVEVVCEDPPERQEAVRWGMNRNFSFDPNRPSRTGSIKRGRGVFGRFRSHSTGHSLGQVVQPGQNVERFTLRLPEEKRKEMMNRALLNRTKSFAPQGSNRGYRTGGGAEEGSSRGGRSYRRVEPLGREAQSDRWVFARAPSFFSRALSIRSPRDNSGEASSSTKGGKTAVRMPSFKCLEPKTADETGLVAADSARAPV